MSSFHLVLTGHSIEPIVHLFDYDGPYQGTGGPLNALEECIDTWLSTDAGRDELKARGRECVDWQEAIDLVPHEHFNQHHFNLVGSPDYHYTIDLGEDQGFAPEPLGRYRVTFIRQVADCDCAEDSDEECDCNEPYASQEIEVEAPGPGEAEAKAEKLITDEGWKVDDVEPLGDRGLYDDTDVEIRYLGLTESKVP